MTETIIAASFVLIPLFLLIPLLGKYIDIRHSTIQTARYEAWEYTVWYRDNNKRTLTNPNAEQPNGVKDEHNNDVPLPTKDFTVLQKEARQRFFSADAYDRNKTLTANDHDHWDIAETNPLWRTHRQDPTNPSNNLPILTSAASIDSIDPKSSDPTPNGPLTWPLDIAYKVIDFIFTAIGNIISWVSSGAPTFDAINLNGYSKTQVEVTVTRPHGILGFGTLSGTHEIGNTTPVADLTFTSQAAVLSDGWNAGGRPHVINEAGGMVITKYLASIPGFTTIQSVLGLAFPELSPCPGGPYPTIPNVIFDPDLDGSLWIGYLDTEAVHPDRLHHVRNGQVNPAHIGAGSGHICEHNICNFAYNVPGEPDYRYPQAINEVGYTDDCN
jgi:hypothetical protein